jgi:transposase
LFNWRRKAHETGVVRRDEPEPRLGFVEVTSPSSTMIEIAVADMMVRVGVDVDPDHLVKVLRAVRQA